MIRTYSLYFDLLLSTRSIKRICTCEGTEIIPTSEHLLEFRQGLRAFVDEVGLTPVGEAALSSHLYTLIWAASTTNPKSLSTICESVLPCAGCLKPACFRRTPHHWPFFILPFTSRCRFGCDSSKTI